MMPVEFAGGFVGNFTGGFARLGRGVLLVNIDRGIGGLLGRDDTWVIPYFKLVVFPLCFSGYPCCIGDCLYVASSVSSCLRFGFAFIFCMRLAFMILLLWFIVGSSLAVAFPTVALLIAAGFVLLMNWLFNVVSDFGEGRRGVKHKLVVEGWSRSGELYSSGGSDVSRYVRNVSRFRETMITGYGFAGEDFQNRGTFIVVRSSVFALSSGQNTPLARDAHNALWNSRRRCQQDVRAPELREER